MCGCLLHATYWGPDLACNPGIWPNWKLNLWFHDPLVRKPVLSPLSHISQVIYSFNLNISPKLSYGMLECDIVMLLNYTLMIL